MKTALSIAGSDCSGGAGIQADLKVFSSYGVFGMTVVTSIVAENTVRVIEYQDARPDIIEKQIDAVFEDIVPDTVKIGMLSNTSTMKAVAGRLYKLNPQNVVIDPVMYAKNGAALMDPSAINTLIAEIIPLADVITPNIPEAEKLTGLDIKTPSDMKQAAEKIHDMGCEAVVVKGGHLIGDKALDILYDGKSFYEYSTLKVDTKHTHGTGCTFSSAIASGLALGMTVNKAVEMAKEYIQGAIAYAPNLGRGHGPTNHFWR